MTSEWPFARYIRSVRNGGVYGTRIHDRRNHRWHDLLTGSRNPGGRADLWQGAVRVFYTSRPATQNGGSALVQGARPTSGTFGQARRSMFLRSVFLGAAETFPRRTHTVPGMEAGV